MVLQRSCESTRRHTLRETTQARTPPFSRIPLAKSVVAFFVVYSAVFRLKSIPLEV